MIWWLIPTIVVSVLIVLIIAIAFFMVNHVLRRALPIVSDDFSVLGKAGVLSDPVKDAVLWLESGEIIKQTSFDGLKLYARFLKNEDSHIYALCCHGYKNQRMQDISNQALHFYKMGYNVLCPHARGHGMSEGRYIGMGADERHDIVGWIKVITDMDPGAKIFLYGVSMGGATVMTTCGEKLPDNVRCAIEDCGYSSIWKQFSYHLLKTYRLPYRPILDLCQVISKRRYGFGFKEFSALEQIKKTTVPFMFIHGDKDTYVPYSMMEPLYMACSSKEKRAVSIAGAVHASSYWMDADTYWSEVEKWLDRFL